MFWKISQKMEGVSSSKARAFIGKLQIDCLLMVKGPINPKIEDLLLDHNATTDSHTHLSVNISDDVAFGRRFPGVGRIHPSRV